MPEEKLSAMVTSLNEEGNIRECLESVAFADEVLLVDSFSTDRTVEIARSIPGVRVVQREYFGSATQKNWAMDRVAGPWILILDADERVTPALRSEIEALLASAPGHDAYRIRRRVYFLGRLLRFSGWQHDEVVRLFRKGSARYPSRRVHADMETTGPVAPLRNHLIHYMVESLHGYVSRTMKYAWWGAAQAWKDGRRSGFAQVFGRSALRFFRTYFLQLGILDGMPGLVFCMLQAVGSYAKWAILWGWHVNAARGRAPDLPAFDHEEAGPSQSGGQ